MDATTTLRLRVRGMDCAGCALKIEGAVGRLAGVSAVAVNVGQGRVSVEGPGVGSARDAIAETIRALGYEVAAEAPAAAGGHDRADGHAHGHDHGHSHDHDHGAGGMGWRSPRARYVLGAGALVALAFLAAWLWPALGPWPFVAATLVALLPVARRALGAARTGQVFTIEMLMTVAAVGALAIGAGEEAAVVVLLFGLGEYLEGLAAARARRSIQALGDLTPRTARLLGPDGLVEVPADSLLPGQRVLVRPGDRVPGDGTILEGSAALDEAPITGESLPRQKGPGEAVFAGSIAAEGALTVAITRAAADNTIARILRLVEEAQESKAPTQRFIDRFARLYMPLVVAVALLVALAPPLLAGEPWGLWTYRALALLLIACPCALVISTPASVAAALAAGARRGLLLKGGAALEAVGRLRVIAFDKTGTLTAGRPVVTDILPAAPDADADVDADTLLRLAAALESGSSHPIARAVLAAAAERGLPVVPAGAARTLAGQGVAGSVEGRALRLVSPRALGGTLGGALGAAPDLAARIAALEDGGKTLAVLAEGERVLGALALSDEPRPDAREGLERLRRLGVEAVMLTGDNARAGAAVGRALGLEARAELLPEDKARIVGELRAAGRGPVGKVGDGINDAPALASADVGIAMGGGTDVALETADAALLHGRVGGVAELVALSRATLRNIRANVIIALGSKAIFLVTTVLGLTGLWIAVLADTGATVLVTLNALRMLRFRHG